MQILPSGKFSDEEGLSECKPCTSQGNNFAQRVGNTDDSFCDRCRPGLSKKGGNCDYCEVGKYSDDGTICKNCPSGKYQGNTGMPVCEKCDINTYQDEPGQAKCKNCIHPAFAPLEGNTNCIECPQGFEPNAGQPQLVSLVSYKCELDDPPVEIDTTKPPERSSAMWVESFPKGAFLFACKTNNQTVTLNNQLGNNNYSSTVHTYCAVNTYNATSCTGPPIIGANLKQRVINSCYRCAAGFVLDNANQQCKACPAGKYKNSIETTSCKSCDEHTYEDREASTKCKTCEPGRYRYDAPHYGMNCPQCTIGEFHGGPSCVCPVSSGSQKICDVPPHPGCNRDWPYRLRTYGGDACYKTPNIFSANPFPAVYNPLLTHPSEFLPNSKSDFRKCGCVGCYNNASAKNLTSGVRSCAEGEAFKSCPMKCNRKKNSAGELTTQCYNYTAIKIKDNADCNSDDDRLGTGVSLDECVELVHKYNERHNTEYHMFIHSLHSTRPGHCWVEKTTRLTWHQLSQGSTDCGHGYSSHVYNVYLTLFPEDYKKDKCFGDVCPKNHYGQKAQYHIPSPYTFCKACASGQYQNQVGQSECEGTPCAPGKFQSEIGKQTCKTCENGKSANTMGARSCQYCPAGKHANSIEIAYNPGITDYNVYNDTNYPDTMLFARTRDTALQHCLNHSYDRLCSKEELLGYDRGEKGWTKNDAGLSIAYHPFGAPPGFVSFGFYSASLFGGLSSFKGGAYCCRDNSKPLICQNCPSGHYRTDSTVGIYCSPCASGYFQEARGSTQCKKCEAGTFTSTHGSATCSICPEGTRSAAYNEKTICSACPSGKYSPTKKMENCLVCPAGKYSLRASNFALIGPTKCDACLPGRYQNQERESSCILCPAGKFQNEQGMPVCKTCPYGFPSTQNRTGCAPCPVGKAAINSTGTTICSSCSGEGLYHAEITALSPVVWTEDPALIGTPQHSLSFVRKNLYKGYSFRACARCPPGKYRKQTANTTTFECLECPLGKFQNVAGQKDCKQCFANLNEYTAHPGQTVCAKCMRPVVNNKCLNCVAGKELQGSVCKTCASGKVSPEGNICNSCPAGKHEAQNHTVCEPCTAGKFSSAGQGACTSCPPGKFSRTGTLNACMDCAAGKYAPAPESFVCMRCPKGKHQSQQGKSFCKDCLPGHFSTNASAVSCTKCANGQVQSLANSIRCNKCEPRITGYANLNHTKCVQCGPGEYVDETAKQCMECPGGKFSPAAGMLECFDCPFAMVSNNKSAACSSCPAGRQAEINRIECVKCTEGEFGSMVGQTPFQTWEEVKENTFENVWAVFGQNTGWCSLCPPGKYQDQEGKTSCKICPAGKSTNLPGRKLQSNCTLCPAGTFKGLTDDKCEKCPLSNYLSLPNRTACKGICPAGQIHSNNACENCEAGQFGVQNAISCSACQPGRFQDQVGQTSCESCPPGTYSLAGQVSCKSCPEGKFNHRNESGTCELCPVGHFTNTQGASACKPCVAANFVKCGPKPEIMPK